MSWTTPVAQLDVRFWPESRHWQHQLPTHSGGSLPPNRKYVKSLGADAFIGYRTDDLADRVSSLDLVVDVIGGDTQEKSWSVRRSGGTLVSTVAGPDVVRAKSARAIGRHFAARSDGTKLQKLAMLHASGGCAPISVRCSHFRALARRSTTASVAT